MKDEAKEDSKVEVKVDESKAKKTSGLKAYLVSVELYENRKHLDPDQFAELMELC